MLLSEEDEETFSNCGNEVDGGVPGINDVEAVALSVFEVLVNAFVDVGDRLDV